MHLFTIDELKNLIERREGACVSLFMPTHHAGADIQQNPIRLKNLLHRAEGDMLARGFRGAEARELLEPVRSLVEDNTFWRRQGDGLALFVAKGFFRFYCLPLAVPELVVVAGSFHVKPLLFLLAEDGRFYLLTLSQKKIRLFECTRFNSREVELKNIPASIDEILGYYGYEERIQYHAGGPSGQGTRPAMLHGHGAGPDDALKKKRIVEFFQQVDRGLREVLRNERTPLVLAAVDYISVIYRDVNAYPALMEAGIQGNPEEASPEILLRQAWKVVEPHFHRGREEAVERGARFIGTPRGSGDLKEILSSATRGKVELLVCAASRQQWGKYDPATGEIQQHETEKPGDEDLSNTAAIHTLLHRGEVYMVEPGKVPGGALIAAVFRY